MKWWFRFVLMCWLAFLTAAVSAFCVYYPTTEPHVAKMVRIAFRFDDYSAVSDAETDAAIFQEFALANIPLNVGVIPFCVGDGRNPEPQQTHAFDLQRADMMDKVLMHSGYQVLLHGDTHQTIHAADHPWHTEFQGVDFETQHNKLKKGKELLEGLFNQSVTCFVPPWETYDRATLLAIRDLGMRCVSAQGIDSRLANEIGVQTLPSTCPLPQVCKAVEQARDYRHAPIVVLFHAYDIVSGKFPIAELTKLLQWIKQQPDIQCVTMDKLYGHDLTSERAAAYASMKTLETAFSPFWKRPLCFPTGFEIRGLVFTTLFFGVGTLGVFTLIVWWLVGRMGRPSVSIRIALCLQSLAGCALVLIGVITMLDMLVAACSLGVALATIWSKNDRRDI